jgi:hypothetical protein
MDAQTADVLLQTDNLTTLKYFRKMELYHTSSVIERLEIEGVAFNGGVIHWFTVSPRKSKRPYARLIKGYDKLDPAERIYGQEYIDELFTKDEINELAAYLEEIQSDRLRFKAGEKGPLFIHRALLPCDSLQTGYRHMPPGGLAGRYPLNDGNDYRLNFDVEGYFDLAQEGHRDRMKDSVHYVRRVMQILGVDAGIKLAEIEATVASVYDRERLYVTAESAVNVLDNIEV